MGQKPDFNYDESRKTSKSIGFLIVMIAIVILMLADIIGRHFFQDGTVYLFDAFCVAAVVVVSGFTFTSMNRKFEKRVGEQAVQIGTTYQQYMSQWQVPFLMLDRTLRIVWFNDAFRKACGTDNLTGKLLEEVGLDWGRDRPEWDPIQQELVLNKRVYRCLMTQVRIHEKDEPATDTSFTRMYSLSLQDITRERYLEQENLNRQTVVGLFYVDGYDQIMSATDENQRPMLEAAIFRSLADLSNDVGGIMTKLERDRYMLQFPRKNLKMLTDEKKFDILENVKTIDTGSRFKVTLSIGVGVDPDIATARRYARNGIELAMGRGGDQAVVRSEDNQKFYGGNSTSSVETNTRVRARLIALALKERIEACDRVLIMGHSNPDLDSLGAAIGVYRAAIDLKKPANIVISAEAHPAVEFLYQRIENDKDHQGVLMDHDDAEKLCGPNTLLVIVDVNRSVIVQFADLVEKVGNFVVIDHHRAAADALTGAAISYVEPYASSASEMVTELLQYMVETPQLTSMEADGLFAGIALDTKNFTVKTGVRTFEAAAYLRRRGADSVRVRKMFKNDMEDYKAKAEIVSGSEIIFEKMAIAAWSSDLSTASIVAAQAADELLDIHGVAASFVLTDGGRGHINVSARSLGEVNVQLVMEELGGGGHLSMAGAQIKDASLEEAKAKVMAAIEKVAVRK